MVRQGQSLFAVNGVPTVLLYGAIPAWRTLSQGVTGPDVAELNANLVALGDVPGFQLDPAGATYSAVTTSAVKRLQANLGAAQTGILTPGQVTIEPTPIRVTGVSAILGGAIQAGSPVLTATSTTRQVTATVDAPHRDQLRGGDPVTIALGDGQITPGTVASIGRILAESTGPGPSGSPAAPDVAVAITPADPAATGTADQVPVTVAVTTGTVQNALAVPAVGLVATSGHPAIHVLNADGTTRRVPVSLGIFDDATGWVQINGAGLRAGLTIILPA